MGQQKMIGYIAISMKNGETEIKRTAKMGGIFG